MEFKTAAEVLRYAAGVVERGENVGPCGDETGACAAIERLRESGAISDDVFNDAYFAVQRAVGMSVWFFYSPACPSHLRLPSYSLANLPLGQYLKRIHDVNSNPAMRAARAAWLRRLADEQGRI